MNPLDRGFLQNNLAFNQLEAPTDEYVTSSRLRTDQSCSPQVDTKQLLERKANPLNQLVFHDEEFYIEIEGWDKNSYVFPFSLNNEKYYKICPKIPILENDSLVSLPLSDKESVALCRWEHAEKRLSHIFVHGFENVCRTVCVHDDKESVIDGCCHHFVNYLTFGMDRQKDYNFKGWYEKLPFVSIHEFDQKELHWGDIVQLLSGKKLTHSMFYIGNGKFINKHGLGDIFFQSLSSAKITYPSDSVRIIRLAPEYHSKKLQFKVNY